MSGEEEWRDVTRFADEDPTVLDGWLAGGARQLADTLSAAGPDAYVENPTDTIPSTATFSARRMAYDTLIHRADAALALAGTYSVERDVAADALDEWMLLTTMPEMLTIEPGRKALLGPGRTLTFQATDTRPGWLVDLTGDTMAWCRADREAAVTVRAAVTELLLLVYRRRPLGVAEVSGDQELLDLWLANVSFG